MHSQTLASKEDQCPLVCSTRLMGSHIVATMHNTKIGVVHIDSVVVGDEYGPVVHVTWGLPFPKLIHFSHLNTAEQAFFLVKVKTPGIRIGNILYKQDVQS